MQMQEGRNLVLYQMPWWYSQVAVRTDSKWNFIHWEFSEHMNIIIVLTIIQVDIDMDSDYFCNLIVNLFSI